MRWVLSVSTCSAVGPASGIKTLVAESQRSGSIPVVWGPSVGWVEAGAFISGVGGAWCPGAVSGVVRSLGAPSLCQVGSQGSVIVWVIAACETGACKRTGWSSWEPSHSVCLWFDERACLH